MNHLQIAAVSGIALALLPAAYSADLKSFLAARKKAGITGPGSLADYDSKAGDALIEVKGTTKGSMVAGNETKLLIECAPQTLCVDLPEDEPWLGTSNTQARLILKITRPTKFAGWQATIVEAVPESAIKEWEDKQAPKTSAAGPKRSESFYRPNPAPGPTRGESGRLAPMQRTSTGSSAPVSGRERYSQTTPEQWGISDHPAAQQYADFILSQSNKITPSEARNAALAIIAFCRDFKLDPRLIVALIICESDFDPGSTSYAGAMGLGQIMPFTRDEMKVRDAYDIVSNIYCTVRHFREFYDKYLTKDANGNEVPNLTLAIAAYNAGPGNVAKYGGMPPFPKTQGYVAKVLAWYKKLCGN